MDDCLPGWSLQGADPADPDFKDLCLAACEGLKERPHEVEKWAAKGVKQYYAEKELNTEQTKVKESITRASQHVEDLETEDFQHVEETLSVKPEKRQFMLGGKKPVKAVEESEKAEEEENEEQKYKDALKAAKKALSSKCKQKSQRWLQMHSCKVALNSWKKWKAET